MLHVQEIDILTVPTGTRRIQRQNLCLDGRNVLAWKLLENWTRQKNKSVKETL
jgi:hypothetical protein